MRKVRGCVLSALIILTKRECPHGFLLDGSVLVADPVEWVAVPCSLRKALPVTSAGVHTGDQPFGK